MEQAERTQSSLNKLSPEVKGVQMGDDEGDGPILLKDYPEALVPPTFCISPLFLLSWDSCRSGARGKLLLKHSYILHHELSRVT